jgi:N-methylhydantoinase A
MGSRLLTGAGYLLKVPAIDLAEVGAGGGSIVWIDAGGSLQIGPHSAASNPGPVCYDIGGNRPTVTDAVLTLGYINPDYLVNGRLRLNAAKARAAFEEQIAGPLGLSLERAAHGAFEIAVARMMRAIKAVSTERGRDPRRFGLFAFGGNGPVFGAAMASALGVRRVVIPPSPGLFSAFGLLYADVEHHRSRSFRHSLQETGGMLDGAWDGIAAEAAAMLAADGFPPERRQIERWAALRYQGQAFELTIPVPVGPLDTAAIAALGEEFGAEHERTYGHRAGPGEPIEMITLRVIARGVAEASSVPERIIVADPDSVERPAPREAYFGPRYGWHTTPVIHRPDLRVPRSRPCIVEEYGSTCVVPPGFTALLDDDGNIILNQDWALAGGASPCAGV